MLTTILTTAIITFVVSLFTTKWLFGVAVRTLDKKINGLDERVDRYFHKLNNVKQTLQNNIDDMGKNFLKEDTRLDEHMHELYERVLGTHREDMRMLLSLLNVESISKNEKEELILAHFFDGTRKISKLDKTMPFVPVKAIKLKKGADITEYKGEKLEFTLPANTDF